MANARSRQLLIPADTGGSNGKRGCTVARYPTGKWNPIELRLNFGNLQAVNR
jgi:hypothetical protein